MFRKFPIIKHFFKQETATKCMHGTSCEIYLQMILVKYPPFVFKIYSQGQES